MNRIRSSIEEMEAVKSGAIYAPIPNGAAAAGSISNVDLCRGVIGNDGDTAIPKIQRMPFPTDCFPARYREMIAETARVVAVPESLPGLAVLGAISASLGSNLLGRIYPGKVTGANLYLLGGAESGVGKTETAKWCLDPLYEVEMERKIPWERERLPELAANKTVLIREMQLLTKQVKSSLDDSQRVELLNTLKSKQQALNAAEDELEGGGPTLVVEDITSQKLAVLMQENREMMACISSDAGDVVNNILGRNHKLDRVDDSLYVKAFSRDRVKVNRVGRPQVMLSRPCLTLTLLVQPDKLLTLFQKSELIDGGFLPRFITIMTDAKPAYIDENKPDFSPGIKAAYSKAIKELVLAYRLAKQFATIETDADARRAFITFHNMVVDRRREQYNRIAPFAARYAEQAGRIGLVLHAAKYGPEASGTRIDLETAENAIRFTEYAILEQLALLQGVRGDIFTSVAERIKKFAESNGGVVKVRDLQRRRLVSDSREGNEILSQLVEQGIFAVQEPSANGRESQQFRLL